MNTKNHTYSFIYHIKTIVFVLLFLGFTINTNGQSDCGSDYSDETIENISLTNGSSGYFPSSPNLPFGINIDCIVIENVECAGQNGDIKVEVFANSIKRFKNQDKEVLLEGIIVKFYNDSLAVQSI